MSRYSKFTAAAYVLEGSLKKFALSARSAVSRKFRERGGRGRRKKERERERRREINRKLYLPNNCNEDKNKAQTMKMKRPSALALPLDQLFNRRGDNHR